MNIKILVAFIFVLHLSFIGISQTNTKVATKVSEVISKQKSGHDQIKYVDSSYGYSVMVPKWWNIKETPSPNFFGGTLPEIDKSKSALLFKAFEKAKFKTLENFENWVISGYKSGDAPKWSSGHKLLFKNKLSEFSKIGEAFKVQLKINDTFYNCCYIIVETPQSYLWIDLTSSLQNYTADFKKLETIMSQFTAF